MKIYLVGSGQQKGVCPQNWFLLFTHLGKLSMGVLKELRGGLKDGVAGGNDGVGGEGRGL